MSLLNMEPIHRRDNGRNRSRRIALLLFGVLMLALTLISPLRGSISEGLHSVAPFMWGVGNSVRETAVTFFSSFQDKGILLLENAKLREEISRMETLVLDRNVLEKKVDTLLETMGRSSGDNRVFAEVLRPVGGLPYDIFSIDVGREQNIIGGERVVHAGGVATGEIIESHRSSSKVKLYSFPGEQHEVLVGEQKIPGVAVGRGRGNFEVEIPQGGLVREKDLVFLPSHVSGEEQLILGIVGFVEEKPQESLTRILFRTSFNTETIRSVEVLRFKN